MLPAEKVYTIEDFLQIDSAGDATFSPDNSRVAYLSTESGSSQIHLRPVMGGDAEQLTALPNPVTFVRYSPVDEVLLFEAAEGGNEQSQLYLLDVATREIRALTNTPTARHNFGGWSPDGSLVCYGSTERNGTDFDIYTLSLATGEKRCIFDRGEWCVGEGFSPRGTYVVVRQEHTNFDADLYLCDLAAGTVELLTPHEGHVHQRSVRWLPDESKFFLIRNSGREYAALARYTLATRSFDYLLTPEWDIEALALSHDGRHVAITVNEEGYSRLAVYDASSLEPRPLRLPAGNGYRPVFSPDSAWLAFNCADSRHALDVWVCPLPQGEARQLTTSRQGVPPEVMVEPELVRYESFDGLSVPAFIYRPQRAAREGDAPVVIGIHGGPESQYLANFQPVTQYLVYAGYAVVAPNIRGSSGYGARYLALDDVEKRLDSIKDIVALKEYLHTVPGVDAERVALMGASYGGYVVLACLAFYPTLWTAGVDTVGIANFVTFLENTAPYRRALREAEYGSLEHDRDLLTKISPIHAADKIEAALMVIHGANDPRVPLSEAEQVVAAVRGAGKHVELLVYPDEGHGLAKRKNKLDAYPKIVAFLDSVMR